MIIINFSVLLFVLITPILSSSFIKICVRPNTFNYVGRLWCTRNNIMHMIYEDKPNIADEESGRYSCIYFWVDLGICDQNETNAIIQIIKTGTDESKEFMIPKTHLSICEVPIMFGFGTRPPAHKTFNLKNHFTWIINTQESLVGIKIGCDIGLDYCHNYVIGSAIFHSQQQQSGGQSNNANVINVTVPVYDMATVMRLCDRDGRSGIEIEIIQNRNNSSKNPIEIDMNLFIRPISTPNTNVAIGTSSTSSRIFKRVEELNKRLLTCIICMEKERNVVFAPCEHAVVCDICAANIMNSSDAAVKKHCPLCRSKIVDTNKFYLA